MVLLFVQNTLLFLLPFVSIALEVLTLSVVIMPVLVQAFYLTQRVLVSIVRLRLIQFAVVTSQFVGITNHQVLLRASNVQQRQNYKPNVVEVREFAQALLSLPN